jgi:hypothetical protein
MKKPSIQLLIILLAFFSLLYLGKPLRELLTTVWVDEKNARFIAGIAVRSVIVGLAIWWIRRMQLLTFMGLDHPFEAKQLQSLVIPCAFIGLGLVSNWTTYTSSDTDTLVLFLSSVLLVGAAEELVFRGLLFPILLRIWCKRKNALVLSAIVSSLVFGLVHLVNLFQQPENVVGILSQVFFACAIGVFFAGLLLRTGNMFLPILVHAGINFAFGSSELKSATVATMVETGTTDWKTLLPTTLFFAFIFVGGLFMLLQSNQDKVLERLTSKPSPDILG